MTTHTAPRLDQNSTGRIFLIRAGAMADGSAWLGDFRSVTAQLLWHDLTKDDSSLSQCQRPGRLLVQPVHQRGGVKIPARPPRPAERRGRLFAAPAGPAN